MAEDLTLFTVYTLSYEKADASTRGEFTFYPQQVAEFAKHVKSQDLGSAFVISTCNRTEVYIHSSRPLAIASLFAKIVGVEFSDLQKFSDVLQGEKALTHLFRVSSGLESQILGDFEIVSQLKTWVKRFQKAGIVNSFLIKSVDTALQISKKIKSETLLSNGTASVSFAAVNYLMQYPKSIHSVLLVGLGKIGVNTAENLVKHIPNIQFRVINRTSEKAEKLAKKLSIEYRDFESLQEEIQAADAIIVSTQSDEPIITETHLEELSDKIILDLSIPNNVAPAVKNLKSIELLNVDDLSRTVDQTLETRAQEIPKAEAILAHYRQEFLDWIEVRKYAPLIRGFKENLDLYNEVHTKELQKKDFSINGKESILAEKLAQKMTNRLAGYILEHPDKADEAANWVRQIFQLDKK